MKDVAVIIDNLVQFHSIRQGVDDLMNKGVGVDLYIPDDPNMKDQVEYAYENVKNAGYKPLKRAKKSHYKVLLEPYPKLEYKVSLAGITYSYRLKFKYSLMTAKPSPVYHPTWNVPYDSVLTITPYEYNLLKSLTQTRLVKPFRKEYHNENSSDRKTKKRLLYLPTFNDVDEKDYPDIESSFKKLSDKYEIIIKKHHATQFRSSEEKHSKFLNQLAKQVYDQATPLGEIINTVDVVLTGNSGSIFEALYYKKPVAVFADDINKHRFGVDTFQYNLVKRGVLPHTDNPLKIPNIVEAAFDKIKDQMEVSFEQFNDKSGQREQFSEVIMDYLHRDESQDGIHILHKELVNYLNSLQHDKTKLLADKTRLNEDIDRLNKELKEYKRKVTGYEQSMSWKITRPLRQLNNKIGKLTKL